MKLITSLIFALVSLLVIQTTLGSKGKSVAKLLGTRVAASGLQTVNSDYESQSIRRLLEDEGAATNPAASDPATTPATDAPTTNTPTTDAPATNSTAPANSKSVTGNDGSIYNITYHVSGKDHREYDMSISSPQAIHLTNLDAGHLIVYVLECQEDSAYTLRNVNTGKEEDWKNAEDDELKPRIYETTNNSSYYLLIKQKDNEKPSKVCVRTSFIPTGSIIPTDVFSLPSSDSDIYGVWNASSQLITLTWPSLAIKNQEAYDNLVKAIGDDNLQFNYTFTAISSKGDDHDIEAIGLCGNGTRNVSEIIQRRVITTNKTELGKNVSFSFEPVDADYYTSILVSVSRIAKNSTEKQWEIYYTHDEFHYDLPEEVFSDKVTDAKKSSKGWGWGVWLIFLGCLAAIGYGAYKYKEKRDNDNALIVQQPLRNNEDTSTYYELTNRNNNQ